MKKEDILKFLEAGKSFGIEFKPEGTEYMGWISVEKQKFNQKLYDLHANDPEAVIYKEQATIRDRPFMVRICELRKDVYESDGYPQNQDYRKNEVHRFYNIWEIDEFLQTLNFSIEDLIWLSDIPHD